MEASRALQPAPTPQTQPGALEPAANRAFEQVYRRHAADVYRYALAVLGNAADAEDVAQTTFLNAFRAFQGGQRPLHVRNWLIAIAHNVCRMRWRAAGHRPSEVALDDAPEPIAPEYDRPDLDEVLRALGRLSFNQRAALVMRELEGRSYREIADVLGLSTGAVEALLFRARRRLRVERSALGALTTVPLPAKLGSVFGLGTSGVAGAGGAALGSDLLLKAAIVIGIGAVTVGTAAKPFVTRHHGSHVAAAAAAVVPTARANSSATTQRRAAKRHRANAHRTRAAKRTTQGGTTVVAGITGSLTQPAPPPGAPAPPPVRLPELPVPPPVLPNLNLPPVPPLPPLPPPPVLPPPPPLP